MMSACAVKTLCENQRDEPAALGSSPVTCEDDGTFKPMQCTTRQTECWCVDGLGHEVPDTRTSIYIDQHKPNCGTWCLFYQKICIKLVCILTLLTHIPDKLANEYYPSSPSRHLIYRRHRLSYDDCLEDKRENCQNCSVLCCV